MKKLVYLFALLMAFSACTKDEPTPEVDQEEVGGAELTFTEVEREAHGDHYHYNDVADPDVESITFTGPKMLPPAGAHLHLQEGKTYRFELKATDFHGRRTEHTFVEKDETHFVFILGIPNGAAEVVYADKKKDGTRVRVGVTGYITVTEETSTFQMRYIMRHLNKGVKEKINTKEDWSSIDFTRFTGANDLDLKFEMHFVHGDHGH